MAKIIDIERVQDQMRVFDTMSGSHGDRRPRRHVCPRIIKLLDRAQLLDEVKSGGLGLALLHVLGPTVQSLGEVPEAAAAIGGGAKHFLVKNYISASAGYFDWDADSRFTAVFRRWRKR